MSIRCRCPVAVVRPCHHRFKAPHLRQPAPASPSGALPRARAPGSAREPRAAERSHAATRNAIGGAAPSGHAVSRSARAQGEPAHSAGDAPADPAPPAATTGDGASEPATGAATTAGCADGSGGSATSAGATAAASHASVRSATDGASCASSADGASQSAPDGRRGPAGAATADGQTRGAAATSGTAAARAGQEVPTETFRIAEPLRVGLTRRRGCNIGLFSIWPDRRTDRSWAQDVDGRRRVAGASVISAFVGTLRTLSLRSSITGRPLQRRSRRPAIAKRCAGAAERRSRLCLGAAAPAPDPHARGRCRPPDLDRVRLSGLRRRPRRSRTITSCRTRRSSRSTYRLEYTGADGTQGGVTLLAVDLPNDLALVRVDKQNAPFFSFDKAALDGSLPKGERLYSLGNPLDLGFTIIEGTYNGLVEHSYNDHIHFTGALNPGMSGGPAVNAQGQVVGVNVATRRGGQLISFLVPARFAAALLARGQDAKPAAADLRKDVIAQLTSWRGALYKSLGGGLP
ncbi:trypsin-like peptidase domain-containing protein [Bradyrhizobium oligotrophicum S58]